MTFDITVFQGLRCFAIGILVGIFYYGGLWYTIGLLKKGYRTKRTLFISWLIRVVILLGIFYAEMDGRADCLLILFAGFLCTRLVSKFYILIKESKEAQSKKAEGKKEGAE